MNDSKRDEADLGERLRRGDSAALEELYNLYFDRLYSMVFNQVGYDHSNAEDVVQEIWLAAIKSAKKFRGQSQPYTWLCSIAWHKIKDFQRRHYRQMAKQQQAPSQIEIPELGEMIDSEPLPEEVLEREETKELVRRALSSLPSHYQQVLTLKYIEGMSAKEISQAFGKSTRSVESLLDRARLALRDKIIHMSK